MSLFPYRGKLPDISPEAFVAPTAAIIGDVEIGAGTSIWFNCVVRGDVDIIRIGANSNLQDGSVVHVTTARFGTFIGDNVTIGHMATIHGCTLENGCFIGMRATIMDGCVVESGAMVAAGAMLTPGKRARAGELWAGQPARPVRPLTPEEKAMIERIPGHYVDLGREYRAAMKSGSPA